MGTAQSQTLLCPTCPVALLGNDPSFDDLYEVAGGACFAWLDGVSISSRSRLRATALGRYEFTEISKRTLVHDELSKLSIATADSCEVDDSKALGTGKFSSSGPISL